VLVTVKGFGGIWERRFGMNAARSKRFAQAAFYNTTGVLVSARSVTAGESVARSGSTESAFHSKRPLTLAEPRVRVQGSGNHWRSWTQILFKRMLSGPERPDFYLFVVTADHTGRSTLVRLAGRPIRFKSSPSVKRRPTRGMLLMPRTPGCTGNWARFTRAFHEAVLVRRLRLERAGLAE